MVTRIYPREIKRVDRSNPQVRRRKQHDANAMARTAQGLAPELTGAGAASIHAKEQSDGTWRVSWDTAHGYMLYQELGTEHHGAQPFLRPAAKRFER